MGIDYGVRITKNQDGASDTYFESNDYRRLVLPIGPSLLVLNSNLALFLNPRVSMSFEPSRRIPWRSKIGVKNLCYGDCQ